MTTGNDIALADTVEMYLEDLGDRHGDAFVASLERIIADAVATGWHAANAETAERLRDLITEARVEVSKRMPFPILSRLDAIVTELEDRMGQ